MSAKTNERTGKRESWHGLGKWERGKDFGKWVTCGKYWRTRELKRQKGIVKCNWELKKMVQIVGNLEWELLKNVEIRKSIYDRITNTRFVDPLFENFAYIKKNHIFSLLFNKIMFIWYEIPLRSTLWSVWKLRRILGNIMFQTLHKIHIDSVVFYVK
jgi:hypothetical protein